MNALKSKWKLVSLGVVVIAAASVLAATATARRDASTIKIAVLSDCRAHSARSTTRIWRVSSPAMARQRLARWTAT